MIAHSAETSFLFHAEAVRDFLKDADDLLAHSHFRRMEGEERTELRMFQRRERKRDDEKAHASRDGSRSASKAWKDSYVPDKSFGREEARRVGSPSFEASKKTKEFSERSDRIWREREPSERLYKEAVHRERDDYASKPSWHKSRGSDDRERTDHARMDREYKERPDHSMKDRSHRDSGASSHSSHKDWKGRQHPRDKEHERGDRILDSKDGFYKSHTINAAVEGTERHSNQHIYSDYGPHKSDWSSHIHDHDIPPVHKHPSSRKSSLVDPSESDNFSRSKNGVDNVSFFHEARGTEKCGGNSSSFYEARRSEKCVEPSNPTTGGDGRSIPKLKLKVGGITHTLTSDGKRNTEAGDTISQTPHLSGNSYHKKRSLLSASESARRRHRLLLQEDSEEDDLPPNAKEQPQLSDKDRLPAYTPGEPDYCREPEGVTHDSHQNLQGVRKSSRIPKKRVFDGDDDFEVEPKRKRKKKVEVDSDEELYRAEEDELDHAFAEEEEEIEMVNDTKLKFARRKRKSLDSDFPCLDDRKAILSAGKTGAGIDGRACVPLTARQKALQSSKEGLVDVGSSLVDFPEGPSRSAPKKQKEVLSAAERQLKKEEAAQKRKQQVEKAAKEIQAVAIQKILCQDSQRKKREGKLQKQREEIEQEKKAAAMAPASNSIRWILGPQGTLVSFSQDLELPSIFSGPLSYPQERERCAGPSCTNAYKYRDSKTLLPLCSLQCYRAVQKKPSEAGLAH